MCLIGFCSFSPPFTGSDQMIIYTFILKGIEKMDFPKKITKRPGDLIRKLCRYDHASFLTYSYVFLPVF